MRFHFLSYYSTKPRNVSSGAAWQFYDVIGASVSSCLWLPYSQGGFHTQGHLLFEEELLRLHSSRLHSERGRQKKSLPVRLLGRTFSGACFLIPIYISLTATSTREAGKVSRVLVWFVLILHWGRASCSQDPLTEKVWQPGGLVGSWWFLSQWLTSSRVWEVWTLRHGNICYDVTRFHL